MSEIGVHIVDDLSTDEKEICTQVRKKCGYHKFNKKSYCKMYALRQKIRELRKLIVYSIVFNHLSD